MTQCHSGGSMAKKTFENLEKEKKEKIYERLKEFFEE